MGRELPRILLIFAGGATVETDNQGIFSVQKKGDIEEWMKEYPELSLIANIETSFLFSDSHTHEARDWNRIADEIENNYSTYDGFVVLVPVDTMLYASSALSFMLKNLNKSVVFTGSPLSPAVTSASGLSGFISNYRTLGVRANFINSVQVATMYVPEVTLFFGNQLLRASRSRKSHSTSFNVFEADESDILGRVDFGIRLLQKLEKKKKQSLKVEMLKDVHIEVIRLHPGTREEEFRDVLKSGPDCIFIPTYLQIGVPEKFFPFMRIAEQREIPTVVFNPYFAIPLKFSNVEVITGIGYEALYAKIYWGLSMSKTNEEFFKILRNEYVHEWQHTNDERRVAS